MKRIVHQGLLAASSLAVLLALGACGDRVDTTAPSTAPSTSSAPTTPATEQTARDTTATPAPAPGSDSSVLGAGSSTGMIDDAQIVTKVNTGIAADKDLSTFKIDVDSKGGMVTLKGTVPTTAAKERAADIAKNVKDVKSVENQLTVSAG